MPWSACTVCALQLSTTYQFSNLVHLLAIDSNQTDETDSQKSIPGITYRKFDSDHPAQSLEMSFPKQLPNVVKEIRLHLCQTSKASQGLRWAIVLTLKLGKEMKSWSGFRQFVVSQYPTIKSSNPDVKLLVREASGVEAKAFVRFGMFPIFTRGWKGEKGTRWGSGNICTCGQS